MKEEIRHTVLRNKLHIYNLNNGIENNNLTGLLTDWSLNAFQNS
jgi:hypothetical protein